MFLRRYLGLLIVSAILLAALIGVGYSKYRYTYPYGRSHCYDKQLYFALLDYANTHGGNFPAGKDTPEASLSLVHANSVLGCANLLCGKTGDQSRTQAILNQGKLLGPDSCGWNYVEGLKLDDDHRLALFWDKEGLGHNGERLTGGGHLVMFLDGFTKHITAVNWDNFLAEQQVLLEQRKTTDSN